MQSASTPNDAMGKRPASPLSGSMAELLEETLVVVVAYVLAIMPTNAKPIIIGDKCRRVADYVCVCEDQWRESPERASHYADRRELQHRFQHALGLVS